MSICCSLSHFVVLEKPLLLLIALNYWRLWLKLNKKLKHYKTSPSVLSTTRLSNNNVGEIIDYKVGRINNIRRNQTNKTCRRFYSCGAYQVHFWQLVDCSSPTRWTCPMWTDRPALDWILSIGHTRTCKSLYTGRISYPYFWWW